VCIRPWPAAAAAAAARSAIQSSPDGFPSSDALYATSPSLSARVDTHTRCNVTRRRVTPASQPASRHKEQKSQYRDGCVDCGESG
jgi:hypothetical protein